ncbi:D-2-hydroxyacid dehydrogenase family protein [Ferrimicrobium acidiphilum]|uniref:Glycerate dehydrogenase n=1 Tax=Ferrimicrobium acidiphilum DSM 19497 TaxID=1121877 RepID=A0A0D8FSG9_9ACTN|nr:D-2-hydroxyacid dehydrogenase family protein [Ferrimicrobium acidiphilum]KJE75894.1 glycerate dehydrogenase [Ferrimicrobium acidiphilum DSM 19497]
MRCAVLDDYQNVAVSTADWTSLQATISVDPFHDHLESENELVSRLYPYEILVVMRERTPLRKSLLERLPSLRLIVTTGMRNASIDVAAANQLGIVVCGTSGHSEPPAELTWALILALSRHIVEEVSSVRNNGLWQTSLGVDLYGKCLGLIGLGKIGNRVARVGAAFGMEVVAWSPHLTESRASEAGASLMESLEALLATSDIVSIHLVLGEGTYGLLGRHELNQMRSTALLINTSRAAIVDQQALIEALQMGTIAGAGLDVFDHEPLAKDDPIRSTPNLIATPHLGYVTERNYSTFFEQVIEDIAAFATGTPIRLLS